MESNLGMYDFKEVQRYNDTLYGAIVNECLSAGLSPNQVPISLTRNVKHYTDEVAASSCLFLGQTCGLPLSCNPCAYTVIGSPIYSHHQQQERVLLAEYCSVIICKESSNVSSLTELKYKTLAVNQRISLSGSLLFAATLGYDFMSTVDIVSTGGHIKSIECVQQGRALAACIDIVTFDLLRLHRPELVADMRIICYTERAPSLPYVTGRGASAEFIHTLRSSIHRVMTSTAEDIVQCRKALLLSGFDFSKDFTVSQSSVCLSQEDLKSKYMSRVFELQTKAQVGRENNLENEEKIYMQCSRDESNSSLTSILRPLLPEDSLMVEMLLAGLMRELKLENGGAAFHSSWVTINERMAHIVLPEGEGNQHKLKKLLFSESTSTSMIDVLFLCGSRLKVGMCAPNDHEIVGLYRDSENNFITELNNRSILAYISAEMEPGGDWCTVVILTPSGNHHNNVDVDVFAPILSIAPSYYKNIRMHRASINPTDMSVHLTRTSFIRYFNLTDGLKEVTKSILWNDRFANIDAGTAFPGTAVCLDEVSREQPCAAIAASGEKGGGATIKDEIGAFEEIAVSDGYCSSERHVLGGAIEAELDYFSSINRLTLPEGYFYVHDEDYSFDATLHLDLTSEHHGLPSSLLELGYSKDHVSKMPCAFGQSKSFNILTPTALGLLRKSLIRLDEYAQCSPRIPKVLRGGAFRSKFIRDLSLSPELCHFLSQLAGCALSPHPMTIMHGHTNLLPAEDSKRRMEAIDKWHRDTVSFVLVVFVSETSDYTGGEFQFFDGTVEEAEDILSKGLTFPQDRIRCIGPQHPGSAIFQQGWQVYHRAAAVEPSKSKERTSFVLSYVASNPFPLDSCYQLSKTYNQIDPDFILLPDWIRHRCWKAQRYLLYSLREQWRLMSRSQSSYDELLNTVTIRLLGARSILLANCKRLPFTNDRRFLIANIEYVLKDLTQVELIRGIRKERDGIEGDREGNKGVGDVDRSERDEESKIDLFSTVFTTVNCTINTLRAVTSDIYDFQVHVSAMVYFK